MKERDNDRQGRRVDTYRRGKKRSGRAWCLPLSTGCISFSQRASNTIYLVSTDRETWGCQLFQGWVRWGNHSTEESWVITSASLEKWTLSLEKPRLLGGCDCGPHTHIPHILQSSRPGPSHEPQQLSECVNVWRVAMDETFKWCSSPVSQQTIATLY